MRVRALGCGREQVGVAELAHADEFVADRCGDQSFGKRVGRDGVDGAARRPPALLDTHTHTPPALDAGRLAIGMGRSLDCIMREARPAGDDIE